MTLDRRTALILLALIVAVGAWLRFHDLGAQSLWEDEAVSWSQASGGLGQVIRRTAGDNYPPLHNLMLFVMIRLFGDSEWLLRTPSAIAGTLNILALYGLTARLGGRFAGLLAALLLALSGFHIWYSQEARPYAVYALLATLFAWSVLEALAQGGRWRYVATGVCGALLLYSHPFGTLTWLCILAGATIVRLMDPVAWKQPIRRLILPQACAVLSFLPWALILAHKGLAIQRNGFWIPRPNLASVITSIQEVGSGPIGLALLLIGTVVAIVIATRERRSVPDNELQLPPWSIVVFLGAWTAGPALISIGESLVTTPLFISRYIIGSLPAVVALTSLGMAWLARRRWTTVAVAVVAIAGGVAAMATGTPGPRPNARAAVQYVTDNLQQGDCVFAVGNWTAVPVVYYLRSPPPCFGAVTNIDQLTKLPAPTGRIFLVTANRPAASDQTMVDALTRATHRLLSENFNGVRVDLYRP